MTGQGNRARQGNGENVGKVRGIHPVPGEMSWL